MVPNDKKDRLMELIGESVDQFLLDIDEAEDEIRAQESLISEPYVRDDGCLVLAGEKDGIACTVWNPNVLPSSFVNVFVPAMKQTIKNNNEVKYRIIRERLHGAYKNRSILLPDVLSIIASVLR